MSNCSVLKIAAPLGIICSLGTFTGCLQLAPLTSSTRSTATVSTASVAADLYLAVETAWEQTPTEFTRHGICQIDRGSGATTQTCTIRIPEGELFFSKTKFIFGTDDATTCHRVQFIPMYYQTSVNAAYLNFWESAPAAVNCAGATPANRIPGCFWGAGPRLYSSWPTPMGKYFNTSGGLEGSEEMDSGNSGGLNDNVSVCNKIDDPTTSITRGGVDHYEANSSFPYNVKCIDKYGQTQKEIFVYIGDADLSTGEDPGVPANDQHYDWLEVL